MTAIDLDGKWCLIRKRSMTLVGAAGYKGVVIDGKPCDASNSAMTLSNIFML